MFSERLLSQTLVVLVGELFQLMPQTSKKTKGSVGVTDPETSPFPSKLCSIMSCRFEKYIPFVNKNAFSFSFPLFRDLSENQIKGIPRKAFRGIIDVKNL